MKDKLAEYDLKVQYIDSPDADPIDFDIYDEEDNVAWVWGDTPEDVEVECTHPEQCIEYDDDEPAGVCRLCGAKCGGHYEADYGNVEDHYWRGRKVVVDEWEDPKTPGGIIGDYLTELKAA